MTRVRAVTECLLWVMGLAVVMVSMNAWAQPVAGILPATDAAALDLGASAWTYLVEKNYAALMGPVISLLIWALRRYDVYIPKVGAAIDVFLEKPFIAFLLPFATSALAGGATALAMGKPMTEALGAIFAAASAAVTTYVGLKKTGEAIEAHKEAAAGVITKENAIAELKKP